MNRNFNTLLMENGKLNTEFKEKKSKYVCDNTILFSHSKNELYDYFSLQIFDDIFFNDCLINDLTKELSKIINYFKIKYRISKKDNILAVGIGNEGLSADSLGAKTLKTLDITKHLIDNNIKCHKKGNLSAIAGSVSGITGIESYQIISSVVEKTMPKFIIAIDTLATKSTDKLQKIIEVSDKGIYPGGGVNNTKKELSQNTLGIPTIAIGIPLVIYAKDIIIEAIKDNPCQFDNNYIKKITDLIITPKEIDLSVEHFSKIIGGGINIAVH